MSHDAIAQNALQLLEDILDEQLEHETEPSEQLARGLFELSVAGYENRVITVGQALLVMTKCYGALHPDSKPYTWAQAENALADL